MFSMMMLSFRRLGAGDAGTSKRYVAVAFINHFRVPGLGCKRLLLQIGFVLIEFVRFKTDLAQCNVGAALEFLQLRIQTKSRAKVCEKHADFDSFSMRCLAQLDDFIQVKIRTDVNSEDFFQPCLLS
jgi:hypothetical protein